MVYEVLEAEPDALPLAGGSLNGLMTTYKARRPPGPVSAVPGGGRGEMLPGSRLCSACMRVALCRIHIPCL